MSSLRHVATGLLRGQARSLDSATSRHGMGVRWRRFKMGTRVMSAVDPGFAKWLRAEALFAESTDATIVTNWASRAVVTEIITAIALSAGASTEAARQEALLGGPLVTDELSVKGLRSDLIGQCVTIASDRFDYGGAGKACFVIGVAESSDVERSTLTILRRL
jgi:hypothetical protein